MALPPRLAHGTPNRGLQLKTFVLTLTSRLPAHTNTARKRAASPHAIRNPNVIPCQTYSGAPPPAPYEGPPFQGPAGRGHPIPAWLERRHPNAPSLPDPAPDTEPELPNADQSSETHNLLEDTSARHLQARGQAPLPIDWGKFVQVMRTACALKYAITREHKCVCYTTFRPHGSPPD